jgi:hypothetical protein
VGSQNVPDPSPGQPAVGIAYFTWLVGLAVGAGLAVTLVGIPILTLVLAPRGDGWLGQLKAYWTDRGPRCRGLARWGTKSSHAVAFLTGFSFA